jgi:carboxypeptidase Taq
VNNVLESVKNALAEIRALESTLALHQWDERTSLPKLGAYHRGEILTRLEGRINAAYLEPRFEADAREAQSRRPTPDDAALLECLLIRIRRLREIPPGLVEAKSRAISACTAAWHESRENEDVGRWLGAFATLLSLVREQAVAWRETDNSPDAYSSLLGLYEPGLTSPRLANHISTLVDTLVPFRNAMLAINADAPEGLPLETGLQQRLSMAIFDLVGLERDGYRFAETVHPFALLIGPGDVGLAVRFDPVNCMTALFGSLHEAGHALYMQGIPHDRLWFGVDEEGASHGIHESQSRFWENSIGRSDAFAEIVGRMEPDIDAEHLSRLSRRIVRSTLRIGADEVSYNLHIALRVELEQALVSGSLTVAELPAAWNEYSERILGCRPECPTDGILQDIHWSTGIIGGFACYLMGNLYASGIAETISADVGVLDILIASGRFEPIRDWLRDKIHRYGRVLSPDSLYTQATGKPLSVEPFLRSIRDRYER